MTAEPSPTAVLQRALRSGSLTLALGAVAEYGRPLDLADALALTLLLAAREPSRFSRYASRWHARFVIECGPLDMGESALLLSALARRGKPLG